MAVRKSAFLVAFALVVASSIASAQQSAAPPAQTAAINVTGTWTGTLNASVDGQSKGLEKAMMVFKQDGSVVTGNAGPVSNPRFEIAKGKITTTKDGTTLTFELVDGDKVLQFELKYVEGRLKGAAKAERNGEKLTAVVELERSK